MKYFLLIIALLFTHSLYGQKFQAQPKTKHLITSTVKQWAQQNFLPIPHPQPTIYIAYAPLHYRMLGMTRKIAPNTYMIDLNGFYDSTRLERTIIHELVHVLQMQEGRLEVHAEHILWLDQPWKFNTPYTKRPWEIEATKATREYCD